MSKRGRIYDTALWRDLREHQLRREPFCRACASAGDDLIIGEHVDHIVPIEQGGAAYDPANLQSLCCSCHSLKTNLFDKKGIAWRQNAAFGCDETGAPLDPHHPFYA